MINHSRSYKKRHDACAVLRRVPLFAQLSDRELRTVALAGREEPFGRGYTVVSEGDIGGQFFVILEGRATVSVKGVPVRTLGPGAHFGEMALIDRLDRTATIRSETQLVTLAFSSTEFLLMLQDNWPIARGVMAGLCRRLRDSDASAALAAS